MTKIQELNGKITEVVAEMRALMDTAEDEKRDFSEEEQKRYDELDASIDTTRASIKKEEDLEARKAKLLGLEEGVRKVVNPLPDGAKSFIPGDRKVEDDSDMDGFRNIGEYFYSLWQMKAYGKRDERLLRNAEEVQKREQTMGTGATGGFALPQQFSSTIRQVTPQTAIVRPRATVIPAGSPPDAQLTFPALDQTSAQNMFGGVVITHTGEGVTMTETTARLKEVTLEPKEISAYVVCTQKLLNNWDAASSFITTQLTRAMNAAEDYDFIRGDGINKALGFINCAAAVSYTRAGANAIAYADVYNMYARAKLGGNLIWIASQTAIPQLAAMVDAGNHAVWIGGGNLAQGASAPMPGTLFGIPVVFADRAPALGTKGDLCLVDLNYYLVKDGSGPMAASSEHIFFTSNKVAFKVVWNVDGRPWLTEPLALEGSSTSTISPFVILT